MDKSSKVLEDLTAHQPQLLVGYQRLSSIPLPVGKEIDLDSSLTHPSLPEHNSLVLVPNQPLVGKSVNLVLKLATHFVPEEHSDHTTHVLLVSSDSHESKSDPPIPVVQESPSSIPVEQGGNHVLPPLSSSIISFDWGHLTAYCLPSYVPFQITVQAYNVVVPNTILDEGVFVSIMYSTTWKALGSPQLVHVT